MELRRLGYLVALADERHFTRAAARERVAQPALSRQIRRLEAEVGLALVWRTTRRVSLTEAGELARRASVGLQRGRGGRCGSQRSRRAYSRTVDRQWRRSHLRSE